MLLVAQTVCAVDHKFLYRTFYQSVGIICPELEDPEHGSISQFCLATYICDGGYKFESGTSSVRICDGDRLWSGEAPVCRVQY